MTFEERVISAYDEREKMFGVKSMQKKFRDSFTSATLNTQVWDNVIGNGGSISQSASTLIIGSGTIANSETYILSKEVFTIPVKLNIGFTMSQRIVNQTFFVELVSVNSETHVPDGKHCCAYVFDGTSVTQAKYRVQNGGLVPLDSSAITVVTTSTNGMYEIEPFADECWFHSKTLDSSSGRSNSYCRHQQIPDPNSLYKIRLRWLNSASVPASNTNAVVQFLAVQDYAELTAEITSGRGQTVAGQALAVSVIGSINGNATITPATPTVHLKTATASTNATSVKTTAGALTSLQATNYSASIKYLKLYNKSSAPTVGTDVPILTIPIEATNFLNLDFGLLGTRFSSGIAYAITGALADSDTTNISAGDVKLVMNYV